LLAAEQVQFEQARQLFWDSHSPGMLRELRGSFEALLSVKRRGKSSPNGALPRAVPDPAPTRRAECRTCDMRRE
jgi:hypothetical protein